MLKKKIAVMVTVVTLLFLGGLAQEVRAVEAVIGTEIVKTIYKVENLVRVADNVVILFDSSGSMGEPFDGSGATKLDAATKILKQRASLLPETYPELNVGLYLYTPPGNVVPGMPTFEFYKMQPFNKTAFIKAVDQLPKEASGPTLMVNAFRKLGSLLDSLSGRTVVLLFTDGTHSDEGATDSPLTLAKKMAAKHNVSFQVVSTTDDETKIKLMEAVASINSSSKVHPFEELLKRPEVFTGAVFAIEESYVTSFEAQEKIVGFKLDMIQFDFDKAELEAEYAGELDTVGEILKTNPKTYIVLAGHTDNVGTDEYNLALSHERVEAVAAYLAERFKIDSRRIETFGYGSASPVASNDTAEGREKNRRVVGFIAGVN